MLLADVRIDLIQHLPALPAIGVSWTTVMPGWFRALAAPASPEEYPSAVHAMISYFAHYKADKLVPAARRAAGAEQKTALARLPPPKSTYEQPRFDLR